MVQDRWMSMELQKTPFIEKEKSFYKPSFLGFHVSFFQRGASYQNR